MLHPAVVAMPLMLLFSASAAADERAVINPGTRPAAFKSEVQVNVSMNLFIPAELDDSDAVARAQERVRRMLYESGSKECELLRATIAGECRLERINVNVRTIPNYRQQGQGLNANGNFSYRITLKPAVRP